MRSRGTKKFWFAGIAVAGLLSGIVTPTSGSTPIVINEYNAVRPGNSLSDGDSFFGSVLGNGGDWFELVVVGDGTAGSTVDMRGWHIVMTANESGEPQVWDMGTLIFSQDSFWSNVQAGHILTFTEGNSATPHPTEGTAVPFGLDTQLFAADNFATLGFAWSNFHIGDSQYFDIAGGSTLDMMGSYPVTPSLARNESHHDLWFEIYDGDPNNGGNLLVGPIGEGHPGYGGSGVNSKEAFKLAENPTPLIDASSDYDDADSSTFGAPNATGGSSFQDFSAFRIGSVGLIWDNTTTAGIQEGGSGTWSNGGSGWYDTDAESNVTWSNANPDSASFGAGGTGSATVTLSGPITVDNLAFVNGTTYTLTGSTLSVQGDILVLADAVIASTLVPVDTPERDTEITVGNGSTLTVSGTLGGTDGFDINGAGTLVLSGNSSTYSGSIDVNNTATLRVTGQVHTASSGVIQVANAATLDIASTGTVGDVLVDSGSGVTVTGTGTIAGDLTMTDGAAKLSGTLDVDGAARIVRSTISPSSGAAGNTPGQINFNGGLTIGANADFTWQLFDNTTSGPGTNFDAISVVGDVLEDALNPLSGSDQFNVDIEMRGDVDLTDPFWSAAQQWTLISASGNFGPTADMFRIREALDIDDDPHPFTYGFSLAVSGSDLVLNFDPTASRILIWDADTSGFLGPLPTDGDGTWINGGNNWTSKDTNIGWDSGRPDFAVIGSDGQGFEGGATHTITVDASNGPIVARGILFENNNPFYRLVGDAIEVHEVIQAKLSATIENDITFVDPSASGVRTLINVGNNDVLTLSGVLSGEGMVIDSRGTLILEADNSGYTGDIDIVDGATLQVDIHSGSGTISALQGSVSNGELAGDGIIGGSVIFTDGDAKISGNLTIEGDALVRRAVLSPGAGNDAGTLTIEGAGGLVLGERADYTWQLFSQSSATPGVDFDQIVVDADVSQDGSVVADSEVRIAIELRGAGIDLDDDFWFYDGPHTWTAISAASIAMTEDDFVIDGILDPDNNALLPGLAAGFRIEIDGGDLNIVYDGPLAGDTDLDGIVDDDDLLVVQNQLGQSGQAWADGDFTGDGVVSLYDAYLLFTNYTTAAPNSVSLTPIPEPTSLVILGAGASGLLLRRRSRQYRHAPVMG